MSLQFFKILKNCGSIKKSRRKGSGCKRSSNGCTAPACTCPVTPLSLAWISSCVRRFTVFLLRAFYKKTKWIVHLFCGFYLSDMKCHTMCVRRVEPIKVSKTINGISTCMRFFDERSDIGICGLSTLCTKSCSRSDMVYHNIT